MTLPEAIFYSLITACYVVIPLIVIVLVAAALSVAKLSDWWDARRKRGKR